MKIIVINMNHFEINFQCKLVDYCPVHLMIANKTPKYLSSFTFFQLLKTSFNWENFCRLTHWENSQYALTMQVPFGNTSKLILLTLGTKSSLNKFSQNGHVLKVQCDSFFFLNHLLDCCWFDFKRCYYQRLLLIDRLIIQQRNIYSELPNNRAQDNKFLRTLKFHNI